MTNKKTLIIEIEPVNGEWSGHVSELVLCEDCRYYKDSFCTGFGDGQFVPKDFFCADGERKLTCDYCIHWIGLKRDDRYWCSKLSKYVEERCDQLERRNMDENNRTD